MGAFYFFDLLFFSFPVAVITYAFLGAADIGPRRGQISRQEGVQQFSRGAVSGRASGHIVIHIHHLIQGFYTIPKFGQFQFSSGDQASMQGNGSLGVVNGRVVFIDIFKKFFPGVKVG